MITSDENQVMHQLLELMANYMQLRQGEDEGGGETSNYSEEETNPRVKELLNAAANGNNRRCRSIVNSGVDVNARDKKGFTALHLAAARNEEETAKELLSLGADIDATDNDGDTPLIFSVLANEEDMVQFLLDSGAKVHLCNNKAMTAADVALNKRFLPIVFQLEGVAYCLQYDCDLHFETLTAAVQEGDIDVIEFWLQNHPNKNICDYRLGDDRTMAFIAALNGHSEILSLLDSMGANFEIADNRCHTPIFCAAQNCHVEAAKFLIVAKRCNVNHRSVTQRTPIFSAVTNGHSEIVKLLADNGADIDAEDEDGTTPLELAIKGNHLEIFQILLDKGAELNHINENGFDYAMIAAHANNLEMLQELQLRGVCVTKVNPKSQSTALLGACQVGNGDMAKFLISCGSNHSHRNKNGVSPALRAAYNGSIAVLRVLGEAGAHLDLPNKSNETAVLCAAQKNSVENVRYLHSKGCCVDVKDNDGKTLAWYAAKNGSAQMLDCLHELKAPLDVPDKQGNSPIIIALKERVNEQAIRSLVEFGCDVKRKNKQNESAESIAKNIGQPGLLAALGLEDFCQPNPPAGGADVLLAQQLSNDCDDSTSCLLDPNFGSWEIIYDDEKKKPIGQGGFGKVYKALTDKHQFVAVKIVKGYGIDNTRFRQAVEAERKGMEILRQVRHANIMTFLRCERNGNGFFIFTELIAGISLLELMQKKNSGFDELGIKKFSVQICSALNHLHTRQPVVLHRDIKCSNIMLTHSGQIKLIDFGLAKEVISNSEIYTSASKCGTICYMAPELLTEEHDTHAQYSAKSDVWAFGCTVYEMCTRNPPFAALREMKIISAILRDPMPQLPRSVSAQLKKFYERCLIKDPMLRPNTAELLEDEFIRN